MPEVPSDSFSSPALVGRTPKKKKKVTPSTKTDVEQPVEQPVSIVSQDAEPSVIGYSEEFLHITAQIKTMQTSLKELLSYASKLEKRINKENKDLHKKADGKKRRKVSANKSPSGFSKPGNVSDELRKFLQLKDGELIARTEVTKRINAYCKEKGLQNEKDKRILKPDTTLKTLLRLGKNDELTFFNLQKYMKVHFPNKEGVFVYA